MKKEQLSKNITVYCGDCREVVSKLGQLDTVVTDPPYGMEFWSKHSRDGNRHGRIIGDDTDELLIWACKLKPKHSGYYFCRWNNLRQPQLPEPRSVITWVKNGGSMGDLEHEHIRMTEIILFYPGPEHRWPDKRPWEVITANTTGNKYHPTEKPTLLISHVVKWTIGTVVDPFMGSGTTGVACANLGRKFIGIEIDKKHFDIACRRISETLKQPLLFLDQPEYAQ